MHRAAKSAEKNWKHIFWYQLLFTLLTPRLSPFLCVYYTLYMCQNIFSFYFTMIFLLPAPFPKIWRTNIGTSSSIPLIKCTNGMIWWRKCVPSDGNIWWCVKHIWLFSSLYLSFECVYKLIIIFVDIDLLYDVNHKKNEFICLTCSQFNDKFANTVPRRAENEWHKESIERFSEIERERQRVMKSKRLPRSVASWQQKSQPHFFFFKLDDLLTGIMWTTSHLISKWQIAFTDT